MKKYNPYKESIEGILKMFEDYDPLKTDKDDFINNIKVKCKDAVEYAKYVGEKIDFDIRYKDDIIKGLYRVETRDGRPARIVCWDRSDPDAGKMIVAMVMNTVGKEEVLFTNCNGHYSCYQKGFEDLVLLRNDEQ